ncbi:hypothetical protein HMPREF9446_03197 [Bacteroides fluxus YIT 12057]|uniref:Uncharacterized protein n=1 Tax=Bacteroides fluxus YIT 12057 TaxID=763034 RepID=F3PWR0_9BACE|nr:hypothetical protein HMPREF9446_03197 [Bacteroides fluxus YIT 12057]
MSDNQRCIIFHFFTHLPSFFYSSSLIMLLSGFFCSFVIGLKA